jgi:integrase
MSKGTRTANGRSSIYLGADGYYHGRVTMGVKDDGSPDRRHVRGRNEAEVTRKVRKLERERDKGNAANSGKAPTVELWMTTYLDTIASRSLAPRSLDDYWSKTRNWIVPGIGKHRLDRLLPEHLDKLYAAMAAAGKAPSHALKVHRIISRALEVAVRRGKVGRNVAKLVDAPSAATDEIKPLSEAETRRLLEAAATLPRNGARWSVALALGLRQGEALGLRWEYVNLDTGEVRVWWQLQRLKWRHGCADPHACGKGRHKVKPCPRTCKAHKRECPPPCPPDCEEHARSCPKRQGGGLVFRAPKGKSKRVVALPPELVRILRALRDAQLFERLEAADVWDDHDLVFCQPDGKPIDPRTDWDEWKALLASARIRDARVHDGRHTAATLLLEQGVHPRVVMEILGHSDIRLTERYSHVASPMARDAAARMNTALWGATETRTETSGPGHDR